MCTRKVEEGNKENTWFDKIRNEFNLQCSEDDFYKFYEEEFNRIEYYKEVFDYVWLSCELKCSKPNEKVYKIVEKDCNISPNNILFIDDVQKNLEPAKERGWNTCNAYGYELDKIRNSVEKFINE